ncbi:serine hydrolase [Candidatus Paracaedibacter symbiosus]|uniref:serine hydrolase n=1 Tax=Candidatus Paracaedibacter symbiosus TaxID=244582 RepID=UPI000509B1D1|nr:serine hydrolase [Candidatus Paracaedibacter symbiosus]
MLKKLILKFIFILCFAIPAVAEESIINFDEFDTYVDQSMKDWLVPGAAIAIVKEGKIVHLKTYGVRSIESKKPVTPETVFYVVSLTKGFTAALLSRLVDEGKIRWEDKVRKYLPDFKLADDAASEEFTIEDLLSQRSGLPGFAADSLVETGWTAPEIYKVIYKIPLKNPFRSTYDYQNVFPGVAGWIAAEVTGKPLSEVYDDYLFQPLHLEHTSIGKDGLTGGESWWIRIKKHVLSYFANKVDQYCQLNGKPIEILGGNEAIYCFEASRGINASITDMAKWMIFQLNGGIEDGNPLISPANIERMRTSHINVGAPQGGKLFPKERVKNIDYGMGWFIHDYNRLDVIGHMGGMVGTRSLIALAPKEKVGIVILSNMGGMRVSLFPEAIRSKFFDLYLKLPDQHDWSTELLNETGASLAKINSARLTYRLQHPAAMRDLQDYVGAYENDLYGTLAVTAENGEIYLNYRKLKVALKHWNGDNFSFQPNMFSKTYSGTDIGDVMFSLANPSTGIDSAVGINLLHEGVENVFYRKDK